MQVGSILRYYELRNAKLRAVLPWMVHHDLCRLAHQQSHTRSTFSFSAVWDYIFPGRRAKVPRAPANILMPLIHTLFRVVSRCKLCMQEQAIEDLKQAHSQRLAKMEGQNKWLSKRVAVLSDQMGWLCEASLRHVEAPHACMQVCPRSLAVLC